MNPPEINSVPDEQARHNRSTQHQWGLYRSHRQQIEQLIIPQRRKQERICILGAGNCNDLDLRWLTDAYRDVVLVDIDADAIGGAARRQGVFDRVRLHAPVDLNGIAVAMAQWGEGKPSVQDVANMARMADEQALPELGEFDVVLSPCVLSQLIYPFRVRLGSDHPAYDRLMDALRSRHVRLMRSLLARSGRGVLVIDLTSSASFAGMAQVEEANVSDLMESLIRRRKVFRGLEPKAVVKVLKSVGGREILHVPPWVWHLSLQKAFLVYGVTFR